MTKTEKYLWVAIAALFILLILEESARVTYELKNDKLIKEYCGFINNKFQIDISNLKNQIMPSALKGQNVHQRRTR